MDENEAIKLGIRSIKAENEILNNEKQNEIKKNNQKVEKIMLEYNKLKETVQKYQKKIFY